MRDQIRNIFNNVMKEEANQPNSPDSGSVGDGAKVDQIATLAKSLPDNGGQLDDGTRSELIKVTMETMRGLDELKRAYLHRKSLLNKLAGQVSSQAAQDEKSGLKNHIMSMLASIDEKTAKFDEDKAKLQSEIALIKNKQI